MTKIAISGSRSITDADREVIKDVFYGMEADAQLITGACVGVDAFAAWLAHDLRRQVHTVVPVDGSRVDPRWQEHCTTFETMPEGTDYRERNRRMVYLADCLIAFPLYAELDERSRRSGTWMTVRLARTKGIPVDVYQLRD